MTVIPDSIEPLVLHRSWDFDGTHLRSMNGTAWKQGEAMTAECCCSDAHLRQWDFQRGGMSREEAERFVNRERNSYGDFSFSGISFHASPTVPDVPRTDPPAGHGFALVEIKHDAPEEGCTCGIYAADEATARSYNGKVYGQVALWGKVIQGEKGARAQYAYPVSLVVPPELENDHRIKSYGVPITVDHTPPLKATGQIRPWSPQLISGGGITFDFNGYERPKSWYETRKAKALYWAPIGLNLFAFVLNITDALR